MIIQADGAATIVHAVTGKIYHIDADELDWDSTGGSAHQMGPQIEYQATLEHPALGTLTWSVWEYPAGALNYTTYDIGPHRLDQDFTISFKEEPKSALDSTLTVEWFRDDEGNAISEKRLASMQPENQKQIMKQWFTSMFEDPQMETPYAPKDSKSETGYIFIWGGPYDAAEELYNQFSGSVSEEIINEAAEELEDETGILVWAPSHQHPDQLNADEEHSADRQLDPFNRLEQIKTRIRNGETGDFSNPEVVAEVRKLKESISELRDAIQDFSERTNQMPGIGHNRPPSDLDVSDETRRTVEEQLDAVEGELTAENPDPEVGIRATETIKRIWNQFTDVVKSTWSKTKDKVADALSHQITANAPIWVAVFWEKLYAFGRALVEWLIAGFPFF